MQGIIYKVFAGVFAILVIVEVWLVFFSKNVDSPSIISPSPSASLLILTGDECVAAKGEIINTLSETPPSYKSSDIIGEITGLRCPCICVKKDRESF